MISQRTILMTVCFILVSCDELDNTSLGEGGQLNPINATIAPERRAEAQLIDFTNSREVDSDLFPCDPLVIQPNDNIDFSGRVIDITPDPNPSENIRKPGEEWCMSSYNEEV